VDTAALGKASVRSVRTIAVERWLRRLQRADGAALANTTKAKIRNLFSVLFNHAIRYEWLGQGRNPITLVRQSAKRNQAPEVLEPDEIRSLLLQLKSCFRLMVLLDVTTGLRRSELFALKWSDVDFSHLCLNVLRSIYLRHIGDCKTEASRKPVPLDERVAGRRPPDIGSPTTGYLRVPVRRESTRSGQMLCCKRLFARRHRHTFSTLLIGNGENVKVVQELMRHASSRCTLEVYSQARIIAKRQAQQRVVQMILPGETDAPEPLLACSSQSEI
jgi:integrase